MNFLKRVIFKNSNHLILES